MIEPKIIRGWEEPSPLDLDQFHERAVQWAVAKFNDKPIEEILTGIFILAGMGQSTIVYVPFEGPNDKYRVAAAMRKMLNVPMGHEVVEAYSFITEAWAAVQNKEDGDFDWSTPPSQRPADEREDIFTINTTLRNGQTKFTRFGVRTYPNPLPFLPPSKKPRLLERDDHFGDDATAIAGTMVNFFMTEEEMEKEMKRQHREARREAKRRKKDG